MIFHHFEDTGNTVRTMQSNTSKPIPGAFIKFRISKEPYFRNRSHHIAAQLSLDGETSHLQHETDDSEHTKGRRWKTTMDSLCTGDPCSGNQYLYHCPRFAHIDNGTASHF
jgi:hypothetical protein